MRSALATAACILAAALVAGCTTAPAVPDPRDGSDVETGRTIHLKAQVVDWDQEVYPGLHTWLWAFCLEAVDPNDAASVAAIEYTELLPTDGTNQEETVRRTCSVPGPTIRLQQGDRLIVDFANTHFHPHTMHWHGQYVPMEADGAQGVTQKAVEKGESFTYEFVAKRAGTLWYHCHVDAAFHVMQGLYGLIIVEPADDTHEPEGIDHEETLVLATMRRATVEAVPGAGRHNHPPGCNVSGTPGCQNPPQDLTPDVFLINGHSYPYTQLHDPSMLHIQEGQAIRVRILNAGTTFEALHLHGHDMKVVAVDGVTLPAAYWVDTLPIGPASRVDVVVYGDNPGAWLLHTHRGEGETNDLQFPGGMHTMLVYPGFEHDAFPSELPGGMAWAEQVAPPADRTFSDTVYVPGSVASPVPGAPAPLTGVDEKRTFRIERACAARGIEFLAHFDGSPAAQAGSQLHLLIRAPPLPDGAPGRTVFQADLGRDPQNTGQTNTLARHNESQTGAEPTFTLPTGNYTIELTGTALESIVTLETYVDYYDSWEDQRVSHHVHQTPLCGRWGEGSDAREFGAPPV